MSAQAETMTATVDEFWNMVGGRVGDTTNSQPKAIGQKPVAKAQEAGRVATVQLKTKTRKAAERQGRQKRPDEVIPLEEGDFRDF